ncbi:MAG: dihydrodipicolinate synthase family protein [Pyrinomonadaceae bacterium]
MKLKGMVPPIGTPINEDETVDENGLRKLVNYLIDGGVDGVFVNGSMGCSALLTDAEQFRAIEIVADEVNGRVPVVAGISDSSTKRVIEKTKIVERFRVDFLTAVVPYFFKLTQQQGKRFFQEVAAAAQKPVLIYNNPYLTPMDFEVSTLLELSEEPNIVGVKDSNQDFNRLTGLLEAFRGKDEFTIMLGTELLIPQGLMMGADGAIGGAHNIAPAFAAELYKAHLAGDYETAYARSNDLAQICKIFQYGSIWGGFEAALQLLGICEKVVFEPYASANADEKLKVEEILNGCGLLQQPVGSPI